MAFKKKNVENKPSETVETVKTVEPVNLIELSADEVDALRRLTHSETYKPYGGSTRWTHRVVIDRSTGNITVQK